jgi:hypothetical protein
VAAEIEKFVFNSRTCIYRPSTRHHGALALVETFISGPWEALFDLGGAESEGRRPAEIFKFIVSKMPFPRLWERFDRILIVRKQRFSMSKFTI